MTSNYVYALSSVGGCPLALSAEALGKLPARSPEVEERLRLAAREGTRQEDWIAEDLISMGYQVGPPAGLCTLCPTGRSGYHVDLDYGDASSTGHIDRFVHGPNGERSMVVEIKTMSRYQYAKYVRRGLKAFPKYLYQISGYMVATGLPALYAVKCRDTGVMVVEVLEVPPMRYEELRNHVLVAERARRKGELAECHEYQEFCDVCVLKPKPERLSTPAPDAGTHLEAAKEYREGSRLVVEGEAKVAKAKQVLLEGARNGLSTVDGLEVTYMPESTSSRLNTKRLAALLAPDVIASLKDPNTVKEHIRITDTQKEAV